jgi:hypothetical protein
MSIPRLLALVLVAASANAATPVITLAPNSVSATVTPGAPGYWLETEVKSFRYYAEVNTNDMVCRETAAGSATWNHGTSAGDSTLWSFVDGATGEWAAAQYHGGIVPPSTTGGGQISAQRGPDALMSSLLLTLQGHWCDILWVRPGVGAWRFTAYDGDDFSDHDLPGPANGKIVVYASDARPLSGSAPPAEFASNDTIISFSNYVSYAAMRLPSPLVPNTAPPAIQAATSPVVPSHVKIVLYRSGSVEAVDTVKYATANGTAIAGVHYVAAAGTLTFARGESLKTIDIPQIDDHIYDGPLGFTISFQSSTGAVTGYNIDANVMRINIGDLSPPELSVEDKVVSPSEPGFSFIATMTVRKSGATRFPASFSCDVCTTQEYTIAPDASSIPITWSVPNTTSDYKLPLTITSANLAAIVKPTGILTFLASQRPSISIDDVQVVEGNFGGSAAIFTVSMSFLSGKTVNVDYATADGTAVAGKDYVSQRGTLTFAPFESKTKTIIVPIIADAAHESDETFQLVLSNSTDGPITKSSGRALIVDDDAAAALPSLSIAGASAREGDVVPFRVSLSEPSTQPVRVRFTMGDGTATASTDYIIAAGELTFAPGETTQTVPIVTLRDQFTEGSETFFMYLSSPVNATIATDTATGTIVDDPPAPIRHRGVRH